MFLNSRVSILLLGVLLPILKVTIHQAFTPTTTTEKGCFALADITAEQSGLWNDPSIWSGNTVPTSFDNVIIPVNKTVTLLGVCSAKTIRVQGKLNALQDNPNADFDLYAENILISGSQAILDLGTQVSQYIAEGTINLIGQDDGDDIMGMGDKFLVIANGAKAFLHGKKKTSWTQLDITAEIGQTEIALKEAVDWEIGDKIVIASSSRLQSETETRTILGISSDGRQLTLNAPLLYQHYASIEEYDNGKQGIDKKSWTVDLRTEVGLLTRNLKIQGDNGSELSGYGGHMMIMPSAKIYCSNIELYRMGQQFHIARYPFHWHLCGDVDGQYIDNCSIHRGFNRAVVVHGTNNTRVENTVAYDIWGSALFLEDGIETGNILRNNLLLGVYVPPHAPEEIDFDSGSLPGGIDNPLGIVPSDYQRHLFRVESPAGIWITNPDNTIEDNIVAGCDGVGFWYGLPESPTGLSAGTPNISPRKIPIRSFKGNKAHSVASGLHFDHSHNGAQDALVDATYLPEENGVGVWTEVTDFTCYKMNRGWWTRTTVAASRNILFRDIKLLDCKDEEMIISSWKGRMYDCLFVGRTPNHSDKNRKVDYTAAMAFYDGNYEVYDSHFENFDRDYLSIFAWFGGADDRCNDFFANCTFKNVNYYNDFTPRKSIDLGGVIRDIDGTVNGIPGACLYPEHPYVIDLNNFEQLDPQMIGYITNGPYYPGKIDIRKAFEEDANGIYSEWGDGHCIHGSVWGAYNQFTVIPGLNRTYKFRWLDEINSSLELGFKYVQNGDAINLIFEGSPVELELSSGQKLSSQEAVFASNTDAFHWNSESQTLAVRLIAEGDPTPNDNEFIAEKITEIQTVNNQNVQAKTIYPAVFRPYAGTPHTTNAIIEAEHFDYGGQFIAYLEMGDQAPLPLYDISNENNRFTVLSAEADKARPGELVEIGLSEEEYSGKFAIRDIYQGEYWHYSIAVPESQNYIFRIKAKSENSNNGLTVEEGNTTLLTSQWTPTGSNSQIAELGSIFLTAGNHVLKVKATTSDYSLDWFALVDPGAGPFNDMAGDSDGDGKFYAQEIDLGRNPNSVCDHAFEFDTDGDQEAWWNAFQLEDIVVTDGTLKASTLTNDASLNSPYLTVNGDSLGYIQIRMRAGQNGLVELHWENDNGSYDVTRRVFQDYTSNGEWQVVTFELIDHPEWKGNTIYQYRLDPLSEVTNIEIDWIRGSCEPVINAAADSDGDGKSYADELALGRNPFDICDMGFEFNQDNNQEAWINVANISNLRVENGSLKGNPTSADPNINSPTLLVDGDSIKAIQVRFKADQNGLMELFWSNENGGYSSQRRVTVPYEETPNWRTLIFDLKEHPEWKGRTIESIRVDPLSSASSFEIDFIRGSCTTQISTSGDLDGDGKNYETEVSLSRNPLTMCDLGFEFNSNSDLESWNPAANMQNVQVVNGSFQAQSTNPDPNLISPTLSIDGDSIKVIEVKMRSDQNGIVELFWANEVGGFGPDKRIELDYTGWGSWQTLEFVVGNHWQWDNRIINTVRLDPIGATTNFSIDFIRGHCCYNPGACPPISDYIDADLDGFVDGIDCDDLNPNINPGSIEVPNNTIDEDCDGIAQVIDQDNDGYNSAIDCDDTDPNANPGQEEIVNNTIDEDCDGIAQVIDQDNDGYNSDEDCDDTNAAVNPGAEEILNNSIDEDCDGILGGIDNDNDGFFDGEDCDDTDPSINPDASEIPNNTIDEDCDGNILIIDLDGDGYNSDEDCDDTDPFLNPGQMEIPNNAIDEDCDGVALVIDDDGDGYNSDEDCDDTNPNINPNQAEIPNNSIDENCDGMILIIDQDNDGYNSDEDCDDSNPNINPDATEIVGNTIDENCDGIIEGIDNDNDGYFDEVDCNDSDPNINPQAIEVCDGVDNNCNGVIDEGFMLNTYYLDDDMDGFGNSMFTVTACEQPPGYSPNALDCNDDNASISPNAEEIPNNTIDEDCDGEALVIDMDADGFNSSEDCDDSNSEINPLAVEICDTVDNNCDGNVDEGWTLIQQYLDQDGDGYGDENFGIEACNLISGYVANANDCDDTNPEIHPSSEEIVNNGIDEDCDGFDLTSSTQVITHTNSITVFPNPFSDYLSLSNPNRLDVRILIYSSSGILIDRQIGNDSRIHIQSSSFWPTGIYFILVEQTDGVHLQIEKAIKL